MDNNLNPSLHCTSGEIADFIKNEMGLESDLLMETNTLNLSDYFMESKQSQQQCSPPNLSSYHLTNPNDMTNTFQLPPLDFNLNLNPTNYLPELWNHSNKSDHSSESSNLSTPESLKTSQFQHHQNSLIYNSFPNSNLMNLNHLTHQPPPSSTNLITTTTNNTNNNTMDLLYHSNFYPMTMLPRMPTLFQPPPPTYQDTNLLPFTQSASFYNTNLINTMALPNHSLMTSFPSKPMNPVHKRYRCNMCGKGFSRPSSLTTHTYSHTGEKPFRCNVEGCGRQFSVVSNLRRHGKVHQSNQQSVNSVKQTSEASN